MQRRDTRQALRQPPPSQHLPGVVFDLDVVMGLSPVIADEQQPASSLVINTVRACEKACHDLMDQCSPARHPTSTLSLLTTRRGTI